MSDRRLIEDLIPVEAINRVATDEKVGGRIGHPALLHLWWARRPLAAARAAVFATLMRADDVTEHERSAAYFTSLCRWGASDLAIAEARGRVLQANAGTPPRVLDLFSGGGAIPLEAQRLGCEATAVELNPVAHLIERCMLEFPQRHGPELGADIRSYGADWVEAAWKRVGHLYPRVRDEASDRQMDMSGETALAERTRGRPFAYLWTRTVPCPNTERAAHVVPLVRQTWLAKKQGRYVALKPIVNRKALEVGWEVVEAATADQLGFDPAGFSKRGRTACLACGAAVDADYIKQQGKAGKMEIMPLAAVLVKSSGRGRDYVTADDYLAPDLAECRAVLKKLDVEPPEERVNDRDTLNFKVPLYGLTRFRDLFTPRQLATLCALAQGVGEVHTEMVAAGMEEERAAAAATVLGLVLDRVVDRCSCLCRFDVSNEGLTNTYARQALPMVWDFGEANPFASASGSVTKYLEEGAATVENLAMTGAPARVVRTSAQRVPIDDESLDAVITDPPYYDNISYADLSDFFYVWLKRSVGFLYPDELGGELTPKRREAIVAPYRHHGSKDEARAFYESEMAEAFAEAHRVLKPRAPLVCVYAHKTTLGWASLVEALRRSGFMITEAWPLDTEMPQRSTGQGTAALASSIFLVARRRESGEVGHYRTVLNQLDGIVDERLATLSEAGVTGSDLVIATMGAALRPYTQYASVELPNGEELPADRFLTEVQARVLDAILREVHGLGEGGGTLDPATRYYVLARFSYGYGNVPFDEANNLARTAGVELEEALVRGHNPLARSQGGKVHFYDFSERGDPPDLGLDGLRLIDVLHGLLWRAAHRPGEVEQYLHETRPDAGKLRVVAQALQGPALRSEGDENKSAEAQACERLLGSWRTLVEESLFTG